MERRKCWDRIAENLTKVEWPTFSVDQRTRRVQFVKLDNGFRKQTREELRASGIEPGEASELDQALEDIIKRSENAEGCYSSRKEARAGERKKLQRV